VRYQIFYITLQDILKTKQELEQNLQTYKNLFYSLVAGKKERKKEKYRA